MPVLYDVLKESIEKNKKKTRPIEELLQIFKEADHETFVRAICDLLILQKDKKKNCVWLYGAPSTGKT